jgi:hypothetical protein
LPGNVVVLTHNANGQYEVLSNKSGDGNHAHYLLDPDCAETWEAEMSKKEPIVGQICYISESFLSVCCEVNLSFKIMMRIEVSESPFR